MLNSSTTKLIVKEETNASHYKPYFPPDIWNYIVGSFLPAYSRVGRNSFHNTCKALSQKGFVGLKKPSIKEVIESCKTADDALNILGDSALCEQLSLSELLTVAGAHPLIAKNLLNDAIFSNSVNTQDLCSLASKNEETARLILQRKALSNLQKAYVVNLHQKLAQEFIATLKSNQIIELFSHNTVNLENLIIPSVGILGPELALLRQLKYFDNPELERLILSIFFFQHPRQQQILISLLQSDPRCLFLTKSALYPDWHYTSEIYFTLMSKHGFADQLITNPKLIPLFKGRHLLALGGQNLDVAKRILNTKDLRDKLTEEEVLKLSLCFEELAERMFDDKTVKLKMSDWARLGAVSEKLARKVIDRFDFNGFDLYQICHRFPALELEVLADKKYRSKMACYQGDLISEHTYGPMGVSVDKLLQLSEKGLAVYATRFARVAIMALKHPKLRAKLLNEQNKILEIIAIEETSLPRNADIIRSSLKLLTSSPYLEVNRLMLNLIKEGKLKNDGKIVEKMMYRIHTHDLIMETASKLRQGHSEKIAQAVLPIESPGLAMKRAADDETPSVDSKRLRR